MDAMVVGGLDATSIWIMVVLMSCACVKKVQAHWRRRVDKHWASSEDREELGGVEPESEGGLAGWLRAGWLRYGV